LGQGRKKSDRDLLQPKKRTEGHHLRSNKQGRKKRKMQKITADVRARWQGGGGWGRCPVLERNWARVEKTKWGGKDALSARPASA